MIIEELQEALQKVRKEVVHILAEKDHAQKELESKKNIFHRDASALEEERDRYNQINGNSIWATALF